MVAAGIGIYYGLSNEGYINPGITITSFSSSSNAMENETSSVPAFYAHVDSSKKAAYELSLGKSIIHGVVTGKENITIPDSITQYVLIGDVLETPRLHGVSFSVLYDSFKSTKTINIYTFPYDKFSIEHYDIDTGINDKITSSLIGYNISINGNSGSSYVFNPSSSGSYNITYSLSYGNYKYIRTAAYIHAFNKPMATEIYFTNYSYDSLFNESCFDLYMNEGCGDVYAGNVATSFSYKVYVNNTYQCTFYNFNSNSNMFNYHSSTNDFTYVGSSGPFYVYFVVSDKYYNSTSKTIEIK